MLTVLIVEDEPAIRKMLRTSLATKGYKIVEAKKGFDALDLIMSHNVDLVLLDWMLPDINGVDLIKKIRDTSKPSNIPIVMLTAKSQEVDKVRALELGADDYLTKPIAFEELGARIKALIRRSHGLGAENSINISGLSINPSRHFVEAKNKHVELGVVEFKLLYFLMKNNGRYFDRQSLIDAIWGQLSEVDERTVDVSILRLRKALKQHNLDRLVKTKRGIGYGFSEINS